VPGLPGKASQDQPIGVYNHVSRTTNPQRFVGLDIHKHCLIAIGVNDRLDQVLGPQRVQLVDLEGWIRKTLTAQDAVVIEMTTNGSDAPRTRRRSAQSTALL
jgi:hypothetical protein